MATNKNPRFSGLTTKPPLFDQTDSKARLTLRIDIGSLGAIGPGKVRLLEQIDAHGSITAAGKAMGLSYRRAWLMVDEMNKLFASPLVDAKKGGSGGGKTRITETGHKVIALYRTMQQKTTSAATCELDELETLVRP